MDRLFIIDEKYIRDDIDGETIRRVLKDNIRKQCDGLFIQPFENDNAQVVLPKTSKYKSIVPVGSIDFVQSFLQAANAADAQMTPLEVPMTLRPFVEHKYLVMKGKDITDKYTNGDYFLKRVDTLKDWTNLVHKGHRLPAYEKIDLDATYVVSEFTPLVTEYRVFVYQDEIMGICNYRGSVARFPDAATIEKMVSAYMNEEHPEAYTLDVGVFRYNDGKGEKTEPIEVHPFVSCGLYGFQDDLLGDMLAAGYRWYFQPHEKLTK